MRLMAQRILDFSPACESDSNKIVRDYRKRYKQLAEIFDRHPEILEMVDRDLQRLCKAKRGRGRRPDFTSENLFRALIVRQVEGFTYREASIRIAESETLQNFCRLLKKSTIDFTLLNKAFCAIRPETWQAINRRLAKRSADETKISPEEIRTDTTVVEANIHWPTDSHLMWDVYRVAAREMSHAREIEPSLVPWRFHPKKVKKLHLFVTRYSASTSKKRKRDVRRSMRKLIARIEKVLEKAELFVAQAACSRDFSVQGIGAALAEMLPVMRQATDVARRRAMGGEKVPKAEKVFSIFEPHTEMIMRGRRNRPVEFGHKILLSQSEEKFITDYLVFDESPSDSEMLPTVIDRHKEIFGAGPKAVAGDMGFHPGADAREAIEEELELLAVPRRTRDFGIDWMSSWQQWRAGIEGTISCLKRAFQLARCLFKGFKNFASAVGSAVFCHNLVVLTRLDGG